MLCVVITYHQPHIPTLNVSSTNSCPVKPRSLLHLLLLLLLPFKGRAHIHTRQKQNMQMVLFATKLHSLSHRNQDELVIFLYHRH